MYFHRQINKFHREKFIEILYMLYTRKNTSNKIAVYLIYHTTFLSHNFREATKSNVKIFNQVCIKCNYSTHASNISDDVFFPFLYLKNKKSISCRGNEEIT